MRHESRTAAATLLAPAVVWLYSHSAFAGDRGHSTTVVCSPVDHNRVTELVNGYGSTVCSHLPGSLNAGRSFAELGAVPRFA